MHALIHDHNQIHNGWYMRWTDKLPQRTDCPYGQIAPSHKTPLRTDCPIEKCPKDRLPHRKTPLRTDRIWIFAPSPCSCWYHRLKPKILPHLNEYIEYIITSVLASLTRSKWSLCFIYGGRSLVNAVQGSALHSDLLSNPLKTENWKLKQLTLDHRIFALLLMYVVTCLC